MNILQKVKHLADKEIGKDQNAMYGGLIRAGLSPSISWQIVSGTYKHKPNRSTIKSIEEALKNYKKAS